MCLTSTTKLPVGQFICSCCVLQWESLRESRSDAFIKFEPFVLHVQCAHLSDAQLLVITIKVFRRISSDVLHYCKGTRRDTRCCFSVHLSL